ncbi:hypothetical protein HMPREF3038_02396 [Akkermansia sp. KLE1797]|nr:hypothetical protein HMPREF3038_02396 [Akkermansia sp. KLE1797]KXU54871.1 hypothetical protein HMPREF3039_01020 [Akkermansia sp. KLE1798]KZA06254.1 hypothetical protein HMPREF1326_00104 [Akkermansia sp. KLE1605]
MDTLSHFLKLFIFSSYDNQHKINFPIYWFDEKPLIVSSI